MSGPTWTWLAILLLGAGHGLNPGMGWLFAVALGMQERSGRAVWAALLPLAIGHGLAIAGAVAIALSLGAALPAAAVRWMVAGLLIVLGVTRLVRHRHPRWAGMRVTARELTVWSLLMASAHGAGLMVLPFVLGAAGRSGSAGGGHHHLATVVQLPAGGVTLGLAATAIHTGGYLLITGALAVAVYYWLGLRRLRSLWLNLDFVWAAALIGTGLVTPLL
jgi:hypothetical protein